MKSLKPYNSYAILYLKSEIKINKNEEKLMEEVRIINDIVASNDGITQALKIHQNIIKQTIDLTKHILNKNHRDLLIKQIEKMSLGKVDKIN